MNYTIESIEDNIARLEGDGTESVFISIEHLPADAKEGDILTFDGKSYIIDVNATAKRRKAVYEKFDRLLRKQ